MPIKNATLLFVIFCCGPGIDSFDCALLRRTLVRLNRIAAIYQPILLNNLNRNNYSLYFRRMTEDFAFDVEQCLNVLNKGGIMLYPTDTIWGIGCDATNAIAVEKIIALKQRPAIKSFVVLTASERDVLQYTASPDLAVFDYLQAAGKPTTVIYEHAVGLADNVLASDGSVAIRICNDEFCRNIIKRFRKPIVSTSANVSGMLSPRNFSEIDQAIRNGVDYVVKYKQDDFSLSAASAIISWKNGEIQVIRP
ncbi:MAG TPA: L-threonylcarbamoyladenylate synthase [Panacibacter sp.]|nr:L-threonylcarbamoyladenylate synthase [Panacibacter sp.]HNP45876.1 L-threonylcarbamoyladenylate synthase [Panacibacter sp.]